MVPVVVCATHERDFCRVAALGPALQLQEDQVILPAEHLLGDLARVVLRPAPYLAVEVMDQRPLGRLPMATYDGGEVREVALLRVLAGPDDGLEAQRSRSVSLVGLPHRELPHGEAQEVEPGRPLVCEERVGDPGLARLQLQPHAGEPRRWRAAALAR